MAAIGDIATAYFEAVHANAASIVAGEPEAQLTTPVNNLMVALVDHAKLGKLRLIRESRLDRSRPDFAALLTKAGQTRQKGYVELKAPHVDVDVDSWSGRNAKQWERLRQDAEVLLVCNGKMAQIYRNGQAYGTPASLPYDGAKSWNEKPLLQLIGRFLTLNPTPITSASDLSQRLAIRTADLRDRILWLLAETGAAAESSKGSFASWKLHVQPDASERDFADGISQVVAYGMVLAALSVPNADSNADGFLSVREARDAIRVFSPVMAAAFAPLVDKAVLFEAVRVELGALETLISAIDASKVNKSSDRRGEPWLYFYEDFLAAYDPDERKQAGVYYTPIDIVRAMVKIADHLLVDRFSKRMGFADSAVTTLDPATGTGTFPLAIMDQAVQRAIKVRGKAGRSQAAANLARRLYAFELLPGPYSVAHFRMTQRIQELSPGLEEPARVILTDTLESPLDPKDQLSLFGDAEVLAAEQNRAKRVKLEQQVTVIIGNPPYRRVGRNLHGRGSGGWVLDGKVPGRRTTRSLFDDILDVAKKQTVFSHHASLYNLYVYFWRWAIWKAFEAHGDGPGIVVFITGSSWLHGPGFVGLRQLARSVCDEIWVVDLGGDNKGAHPEENVFAIETPVSVVVLVRDGKKSPKQAAIVRYRKVDGTAAEKLEQMKNIAESDEPLGGTWVSAPEGWTEPLRPATGGADWFDMPRLADIFPWQQPGCKFGRTWPIGPSKEVLEARWMYFVRSPVADRPGLFVTGSSGRNTATKVEGLRRLKDLEAGEKPQEIVRYGFRSFDRQWAFADARMAKTESPSLWNSVSDKQVFMTAMMSAKVSEGPCLTVTTHVPDLHYFRGSFGGKDVMPLYRDASAKEPNLSAGLPALLMSKIGIAKPTVEDVAAYVYGLLSSPNYQSRFTEALKTPGIRVPITASAKLWAESVALGRYMLWLQTYAERFQDKRAGRGSKLPDVEGIGWDIAVSKMPETPADILYDEKSKTLSVGDGQLVGVRPDVWAYSVSGLQVIQKWLGYRTHKGAGRSTSSASYLNRIRPEQWSDEWNDELLDLIRVLTLTIDMQNKSKGLLQQICAGPLISVKEIPVPRAAERQVPESIGLLL